MCQYVISRTKQIESIHLCNNEEQYSKSRGLLILFIRSVAASKVRKADAEAELKDEEGQQSKKQKIEK